MNEGLSGIIFPASDVPVFYIVTTLSYFICRHIKQINPRVDDFLDGPVSVYAVIQGVAADFFKNNRVCLALQTQQSVTATILYLGNFGLVKGQPKQFRQAL